MHSDTTSPAAKGQPPDLGARVTGWVLDESRWQREDRVRVLAPARCASGSVVTVYPYAPSVVGIRADDGARLTVQVQR